jgi:hypothetical protein
MKFKVVADQPTHFPSYGVAGNPGDTVDIDDSLLATGPAGIIVPAGLEPIKAARKAAPVKE